MSRFHAPRPDGRRSLAGPLALLAALALGPAPSARAGSRVPAVASYRIEARWDEAKKTLTGKETVTFVNRTGATYGDLVLHLYLNAFRGEATSFRRDEKPDERRRRRPEENGSVEVTRLVLGSGEELTRSLSFVSPDDGNAQDRTLARVPLPRPVGPGEALTFTVEFASHLPRNGPRTGWQDDFVFGGQWFPKLAKATDRGWSARQFFAPTEFFADFGDYDVTLDAPAEWAGKTLGSGVPRAEAPLATGRVRLAWDAPDVHDFAFAACPRCEVQRGAAGGPSAAAPGSPGPPRVEIALLLQPDHRRATARYLEAARTGLATYSQRYGPYPYPRLAIVDPPFGSDAEGMEYPTLFAGNVPWLILPSQAEHRPESVVAHELAHQWFQGIVATNEPDEAHLDEGLASYAADRLLRECWGDPRLVVRPFGVPFATPLQLPRLGQRSIAFSTWLRSSRTDASLVPTYSQADGAAVRVNAYERPALLFAAAERTWGREAWDGTLRDYATRFAFRHPTTADFLAVVRSRLGEEAARTLGGALSVPGGTGVRVASATATRAERPPGAKDDGAPPSWNSTALLVRTGDAAWPVDVELRFAGGHVVKRRWDGSTRWIRYRATGAALVAVVVDPERKNLLDGSPLDDALSVEPDPEPARGLARRVRYLAQFLLEAAARISSATVLSTAAAAAGAGGAR